MDEEGNALIKADSGYVYMPSFLWIDYLGYMGRMSNCVDQLLFVIKEEHNK